MGTRSPGQSDGIYLNHQQELHKRPVSLPVDLVVLQGSPRANGNCSILAGWAVEAAHELGKTARVIYPYDMDIRSCIGCYQCYNTGSCIFDDDMSDIIGAIRNTSCLWCALLFIPILFLQGSN